MWVQYDEAYSGSKKAIATREECLVGYEADGSSRQPDDVMPLLQQTDTLPSVRRFVKSLIPLSSDLIISVACFDADLKSPPLSRISSIPATLGSFIGRPIWLSSQT